MSSKAEAASGAGVTQADILREEAEAVLRAMISTPSWNRLDSEGTTINQLLDWAADLVASRAGIYGRGKVAPALQKDFRKTAREVAEQVLDRKQIDRGITQVTASRKRDYVIVHHAY